MSSTKDIWEARYRRLAGQTDEKSPSWLNPWKSKITQLPVGPVLDLGCGDGRDIQVLQAWGSSVVGLDFAWSGLARIQPSDGKLLRLQADLERPLPFREESFSLLLASLSLHYVPWSILKDILRELWRCLFPGGALLARFNSVSDRHFGAPASGMNDGEMLQVQGIPKRFFSADDFAKLFGSNWENYTARERSTHRFGKEKHLWELWSQKSLLGSFSERPQKEIPGSCSVPEQKQDRTSGDGL